MSGEYANKFPLQGGYLKISEEFENFPRAFRAAGIDLQIPSKKKEFLTQLSTLFLRELLFGQFWFHLLQIIKYLWMYEVLHVLELSLDDGLSDLR